MKKVEIQSRSNVTALSAFPWLIIALAIQMDLLGRDIESNQDRVVRHVFALASSSKDNNLFDNATTPKIVIIFFDPYSYKNGLAARMRSFGLILEFSFKEKRILLLIWYDAPLPLESFLVPHLMNFEVPVHYTTKSPHLLNSTYVTGSVRESQPDRVISFNRVCWLIWQIGTPCFDHQV